MSQRHVDLLMEAVNRRNQDDEFICISLDNIVSVSDTEFCNTFVDLKRLIMSNINSNLKEGEEVDNNIQVFDSTTFYVQGMSRKEWAEIILAPLALQLPDDGLLED